MVGAKGRSRPRTLADAAAVGYGDDFDASCNLLPISIRDDVWKCVKKIGREGGTNVLQGSFGFLVGNVVGLVEGQCPLTLLDALVSLAWL